MLGDILRALTDATRAQEALDMVATPRTRERVAATALADGVSAGEVVAARVRQLLDYGSEEVWLDLVGAMANSPQPGLAAVERVVALSFPEPERVRITHHDHGHARGHDR